jgi:hypothetical protein
LLPLDDLGWNSFKGGYRVEYNAAPALRRLLEDGPSDELWEELFNELHHQGDVDQASFAVVPWLVEYIRRSPKVDWNALALIAVIELERPKNKNPRIHTTLSEAYFTAIQSIPAVLGDHLDQVWSEEVMQSATTCIALARGQKWFAKAYFELDRDTASRWFTEEFGWDFGDE